MTTFQITVRGDDVELRGFITDYGNLEALTEAVQPYGWIVVGSIAENQEGTAVEAFQEKYRHAKTDGAITVEHHLARLLSLIAAAAEGGRLTIAHKDGEGADSWVVAVERNGEEEVIRTAETMAEAMHGADEVTRDHYAPDGQTR